MTIGTIVSYLLKRFPETDGDYGLYYSGQQSSTS